ncbi:Similar to PEPD: Xaa-Pro dipeptidase (Homo sapiens) [Cotesia congregata]|uniref:Xaa-Pro dipeptidase n=1 Tax=Cotesia congregata TaxID=51543 RepID=A0A8J2HGQ2_COTCN|nr:Similar to PEPD: Xaa-Pro dipeptidase (Homo sapiens) [Cotesia congregata]
MIGYISFNLQHRRSASCTTYTGARDLTQYKFTFKMATSMSTNKNKEKCLFMRGEHTMTVPKSLFYGNRTRLAQRLREKAAGVAPGEGGFVLLQGGDEVPFNDTDINYEFRQESFFQWAFGVEEPGCFGALEITTGKSIIFFPRLPAEYEIWCGKLSTLEEFKERYGVDETYYVDEIAQVFDKKNAKLILTLFGQNSDSGLYSKQVNFDGIEKFKVDNTILYPEICECSDAHKMVMRAVRPGYTEYQGESIFKHYIYSVGGCRHISYTCICGSGHNASILHYGHAAAPNDRTIKDGDICLFDMGGNYCGYAADITCSFPANGKFTVNQKFIYNAVLGARNAVIEAAKPGVSWMDMHLLANKVMLEHLKQGNLLVGEVSDMINAGLNEIFQPHGLGHLLGLDVHDVGGYLPDCPKRSENPGVRKLRTARKLLSGMVLTIEPGCYFIDSLLDAALANPGQSKFINPDKLKLFRGFGGVRIEDDVLITETGVENLTFVPRTVEEIEEWMAHGRENLLLPQELLKP